MNYSKLSATNYYLHHPLTTIQLCVVLYQNTYLLRALTLDVKPSKNKPIPDSIKQWMHRITEFLDGNNVDLSVIPLEPKTQTPFTHHILLATSRIERGKTLSYSALAHAAGFPKAARAVATVMRKNSFPLIIPCHRVVASNGIGGYMGATSGRAIELKQALLSLEKNTP